MFVDIGIAHFKTHTCSQIWYNMNESFVCDQHLLVYIFPYHAVISLYISMFPSHSCTDNTIVDTSVFHNLRCRMCWLWFNPWPKHVYCDVVSPKICCCMCHVCVLIRSWPGWQCRNKKMAFIVYTYYVCNVACIRIVQCINSIRT
jgi:hypothetical protein